ncbi:MAG: outer membrane lipoprotein-sorting protein [Cycloclasticus sp.]|nr:MAG: outer membrane lipoprotein-sorting protein [Cycloclasticus sp.]
MADTNRALEAWKTFAAEQNNPNYDKWVSLISDPKAIALAKEWKDLRGYDAYDLMDKAKLPADLKPGLVITAENKANYPWLKEYLPKEIYDHIGSEWGNIAKVKIVPANTYYMHEGYLKNTKEIKEKNTEIKINEKGMVVYADGSNLLMKLPGATAIPFLHPKNGLELNWSFIANSVNTDTLDFTGEWTACTAEGELERAYKGDLWWWHYHGRSNVGPMGDIDGKEEFIEGGSIFFLEPNDVRGLAGVRQRYADANKEDDFKVFIPSLRRTRLLTGSDSQDPIAAGLDITWDDWRAYWVKTDITKFEYKLTGEGFILGLPEVGHAYNPIMRNTSKCSWDYMEVELRPVWILDIIDKTGSYQYSKRRNYIDKELYYTQYQMTWDPRGKPYRNWYDALDWRPSIGDNQWRSAVVNNEVSNRAGTIDFKARWDNREVEVSEEMFDIDQLRDYQ